MTTLERAASASVRVSVLITTYQHERYIADALNGVLGQTTDFSVEVLVGDDASTDRTRSVIARYAEAHPDRLQTYFPDQNLGAGGKLIFHELIRRSRGEYIAVLDGDDYWTSPDKLRRQVAYLDAHPEYSMCFHNVLCHYEDGSSPDVPHNKPRQASELDVGALLDRCWVASCSPVFRRETIDPLPGWYFDLPFWGDWPLYFLAARHGKIRYLPDLMGVYRIHPAGMHSGLSLLEALRMQTDFYEHIESVVPPEHEARRRQVLAKSWIGRGLEHERLGERVAARRCLDESLRARRFHLPLHGGTGDRRRLELWLRLKAPIPLHRKSGLSPPADTEEGSGRTRAEACSGRR